MRLAPLVLLGASIVSAPAALEAAPGLASTSGGITIPRPSAQLFLGPGEGFTPRSSAAGILFSGSLSIQRSGEHRFFVSSGSLRVDGENVGASPVRLEAGSHRFEFRQARTPGALLLTVEWEGPGFAREPIPSRYFQHEPAGTNDVDGRALFEDLGCSNCHLSDSRSIHNRPGPVLTGLGGRVRPQWIRHWLDAPEEFRPWATMPTMLSSAERADVAAFLASLPAAPIQEASPNKTRAERGRTTFQSFGCAACHGSNLPLAGLGSKLTVGRLQQFLLDPLRHSPAGRMPSFRLSEREALELAEFLALSRNESFERQTAGGDVANGRELVAQSGCLACHSLEGLDPSGDSPTLSSLASRQGCLAATVPAGLPRYRFSDGQRHALRKFVDGYRASPDVAPAPTYDLARRLQQLRCNACHEINAAMPTGAIAEQAPPLTGVGRKLKVGWIEQAISSGSRALDWQELRMPSYGGAHAGWLAGALAKASGVDPFESDSEAQPGDPSHGLDMLGVDGAQGGMGCVGCHGWGEFPALGENGPNLSDVAQRLRRPWFDRWMRDPPRILAGTSMPSYFGGGQTPETTGAITDLWAAFAAAPDLPPPFGFRRADASLGGESLPVPQDRAIVIRWDMPEATPAAIAVGLPGGVSYCFDAGESRLRYVWRGGFVDMTRTLLTKKSRATNLTETAAIVGEVFFREGPAPIRVGERERIPQRRFRGYRLVESVPEFHYQLDGIDVHEQIAVTDGGIVRRFRIPDVDQPMWFVPTPAAGVEIRSTLDGFVIPSGQNIRFEVSVVAR